MLTTRNGLGQFDSSIGPIFQLDRGRLLEFGTGVKSSPVIVVPLLAALLSFCKRDRIGSQR